MSIYTHQDANIRKTWILMTSFFLVVIFIGWVFSYIFANTAILFVAVIAAILMNIFAYWNSDKLVIMTSGAKEAPENSYRELHNIVENLAITAGLPKPRIYVVEDQAPNAFATGRNVEHALVAVTTGLLKILDRSELEGVLAHELSHIGNRDMLVSTISVVLVGFITLLSDFLLRWSLHGGGGNHREGRAQLIMVVLGFVLMLIAPIIAQLMHLAVSRKREFLADASGALLTRYPDALASALQKIGSYSAPMAQANHATAHLFISNPFGGGKGETKKFLTKLFMTHPPIEERVRALRQI